MHQDAMTYVRKYGSPDLFITMTCNPNWSEMQDNLLPGQKPKDRPNLVAQVFHLKLKKLVPLEIYDNHKEAMAEDFLCQQHVLQGDEHLEISGETFNVPLNDLQEKVTSMGGRQLSEYGLPRPQAVDNDREYCQEISYDRGKQQAYVERNAAQTSVMCMTVFAPWSIGTKEVCYFWMLQVEQVRLSYFCKDQI